MSPLLSPPEPSAAANNNSPGSSGLASFIKCAQIKLMVDPDFTCEPPSIDSVHSVEIFN